MRHEGILYTPPGYASAKKADHTFALFAWCFYAWATVRPNETEAPVEPKGAQESESWPLGRKWVEQLFDELVQVEIAAHQSFHLHCAQLRF